MLSLLNLISIAHAQDVAAVPSTVTPFPNLGTLISTTIQVAMLIAGLIVLFIIILGGIQYVTSGGDKEAAQGAKNRITAALVGLLILVSAFAITMIVEKVFGIRILSGITFPAATNMIGQ